MSMLSGSFLGEAAKAGIIAGFCLFAAAFGVRDAEADQVSVSDEKGEVFSAAEIPSGSVAAVSARLTGGQGGEPGRSSVSLEDEVSGNSQKSLSDAGGMVEFAHVAPGTYLIKPADPRLSVTDVKVSKADIVAGVPRPLSDERSRTVGRAMYVAGASAVAGIAGMATVLSRGGSSGETEAGSLGFLNVDGAVAANAAAPHRKPQAQVAPFGVYDDVAPNPGPIIPAPGQGRVNPVPPAHGPFGPDAGNTGSGGSVENPSAPGQIAPAPPITQPMTPS